jgi:hypothetical protein
VKKASAAKRGPSKPRKPARLPAKPAGREARPQKAARPPAPARKPVPSRPVGPGAAPAAKSAGPATAPPGAGKAGVAAKGGVPLRPGVGPRPGEGVPPRPAGGKKSRKSSLSHRRPGFVPGDLLLPGGPQGADEIQYLLRGCVAAEHPSSESGVNEIIVKKASPEAEADRGELLRYAQGMAQRFDSGSIEPLLPIRPPARRNFQGVVERAKHRRREIGAFLRGLDLGRTETSHMDSHGEASLQSLMEWAARLENLVEADEPEQADYAQFHRGMDQLESTTEALIVDVELTLRRLRDRVRG